MGCASSKNNTGLLFTKTERTTTITRGTSASSQDSGIELNCPTNLTDVNGSISDKESTKNETFQSKKGGIAFEISLSTNKILQQHSPRQPLKHGGIFETDGDQPDFPHAPERLMRKGTHHVTAEEIQQKQLEAERKREMDRLAIIARQRRRELHAQKVVERKKQQNWMEDTDEDISDVDETFNADDNFDWDDVEKDGLVSG